MKLSRAEFDARGLARGATLNGSVMPGLDTASRVYPTCGAPPTVSKHVPPSHELEGVNSSILLHRSSTDFFGSAEGDCAFASKSGAAFLRVAASSLTFIRRGNRISLHVKGNVESDDDAQQILRVAPFHGCTSCSNRPGRSLDVMIVSCFRTPTPSSRPIGICRTVAQSATV